MCGIIFNCGTCSVGKVCSANECLCPLGTTNTNGQCVTNTATGIPNYALDFSQLSPASPIGYDVNGKSLSINQNGDFLIRWDKSANVVHKYTTSQSFNIKASSGTVAFACRTGQSGAARAKDRVEWRLTEIDGASATLHMCMIASGSLLCNDLGTIPFASAGGVDVTYTMGWDDSNNNILLGLKLNGSSGIFEYSGYTGGALYPSLGSMSFFFSSTTSPRPVITNLKLATSTTLTVTLSICINDADWQAMFYSLTKANQHH